MQDLKVALVQYDILWEDAYANRLLIEDLLRNLEPQTDVVCLPEMFNTGFTMNAPSVAETMDGRTVSWMKSLAIDKQVLFVGSICILEDQKYFNRFIAAFPNGDVLYYDKAHLFVLADEQKTYSMGNKPLSFDFKGYRFQSFVCFDLRFPVWCRNNVDADVQLYVANWPAKRSLAWKSLLQARAIENQAYVIGVNRVGVDGLGHGYDGHTSLFDPMGECVLSIPNEQVVSYVTISKEKRNTIREHLPFLDIRDSFILQRLEKP